MINGQCLCGKITFETSAAPQGLSMCHCGQCRRQSGGIWSSGYVAKEDLKIDGPVTWFESSPSARRGFCASCGSFLFWEGKGEGTISFSLGSIEQPTGLVLEKHIFVADKGDYYKISDGLPQQDH